MKQFLAEFLFGECIVSRKLLQPIINFGFRFYVAYVFFKSGLTKVVNPWSFDKPFKDILSSDYSVSSTTKDLFAYEFNVPLLPPDVAAYLATYAELILPIFLVLGFFTRPAAIALFILNAVATWSLAQTDFASAVGHWQHILWGTILAFVIAYGPSKVSIDSWIQDNWKGNDTNLVMKLIMIAVFSAIGYFLLNKYL